MKKLPRIDIRWLYVFYTYAHPYRFKIGIAKDVEQRRAGVEASMSSAMNRRVKIRVALYVPSIFSESQEAKIHRWLYRLRDRGMVQHSGYSEWFWFWILNFGLAVIVWAVCYWNGYYLEGCYVALITMQPFYPLPPVLIVVAVFVMEIVVFLAGAFLAGFILFHAYQFLQL